MPESNKAVFADVSFTTEGDERKVHWTHHTGDLYVWVGTTPADRRWRSIYSNPIVALAVNAYRGRLWLHRNGRRKLIKTVFN